MKCEQLMGSSCLYLILALKYREICLSKHDKCNRFNFRTCFRLHVCSLKSKFLVSFTFVACFFFSEHLLLNFFSN